MHRSSETIGAIAAALAKAQGELTNPEKSPTVSQDREETNDNRAPQADGRYNSHARCQTAEPSSSARQLTLCFQRLANLDNGVFERLGRYE